MKIIPVEDIQPKQLMNSLLNGAVMIYPTETVAGIGCIGSNEESVKKVFDAKQRDQNKPVSYAFASVQMIERYAVIPDKYRGLLDFLPGPLTLILPKREDCPEIYGITSDSIGVRIPDVPWLLDIIKRLDEPIITTSANISGSDPARNTKEINQELLSKVDILISWKGGLNGQSSTVISLINNIKVLREGEISENKIMEKCQ